VQTVDARKSEFFYTFAEINRLINSDFQDIQVLLIKIMDSARRLCDAEFAGLLLADKDAGVFRFEIAVGSKGSAAKSLTIKLDEGIAGWVFQHSTPAILKDAEKDKARVLFEGVGIACETVLIVPVCVKGVCIGVIALVNKKDGRFFTDLDIPLLEICANQTGLAFALYKRDKKDKKRESQSVGNASGTHTLIAKSPLIIEKLDMIERIAKTDSSVLILGESGVGKELFAEQVHTRSLRRDAPFIRVNCAALPENLLESELFGYVKGAFTGAVVDRKGRFELADGGSIFLDEIGEVPLSLQAKLLRVLQQKVFERVGDGTPVRVNVRIMAATNRDLETMTAEGKFRSDLYYRLNVFPLYIPALRRRPEDIPALALFFLKKYSAGMRRVVAGFSDRALRAMLTYSWPGNVRELENCVERACALGQSEWIEENDLFPGQSAGSFGKEEKSRDLKTALNAFKTQFIKENLEENNWNQTATAKILNIQRTYLSRLIKELDIEKIEKGEKINFGGYNG
jgi:Nif-specific regulatory protein